MPRFVLEIGTEELPPRFFPVVLPQLREHGAQMLERARLAFREVKVYGTPRRLALIAEDLAERQVPHTREERGPSAKVAFDAEGKPTKAALGFARRAGVALESLERRETEQGEYVFAVVEEPELAAKDALAPLLPALITGLTFPKTMRWGTGKLRFGRPIRWLLALVDEQIVEFELEGLKSGRLTRGHPVLADGMFEVASADGYEGALRERHVIVDPGERLEGLNTQLLDISRALGARVLYADMPGGGPGVEQLVGDPDRFSDALARDLALQTVFLVEHPSAASGSFEAPFLRLPREVLTEAMEHVQSYFPVLEPGNVTRLLAKFVAVRDGGAANLAGVVAGWESVLRAKLIDASFFYDQDLQTPLADRVPALRGVAFHGKLGTMYGKMERIRAVAAEAARQVGLPPERVRHLDRAAYLCKADLVTHMVQEMPSLQGVMGREYAHQSGENQIAWEAIGQHYRPRFPGDPIPDTDIGDLLALADKLDTVAACFAGDLLPTGSSDPLGLRREGSGVVRILTAPPHYVHVDFCLISPGRLTAVALQQLYQQVTPTRPQGAVAREVVEFLRQRLETQLMEEERIRYDLVQAAVAVGWDDLPQAAGRARALQQLSSDPAFIPTVVACTRPMNITKDFEGGDVHPDLFVETAERELWDAYSEVAKQADQVNLIELFKLFADHLRGPIDRYFTDVLVMHEDPAIRRNRLAMCWQLSQLFRRIADFSLIVQV